MTQDRGSFRVARAVFDHPALAGEPYDPRLAWLSLIADAAWASRMVTRVGRLIKLERGQLAASHRFLSERWAWDHRRVARFLDKLVVLGMIQVHMESGIGIITITNYELYQSDEPSGQSRGSDGPRIGAVNGTVSGAVADGESACAAGIFEFEQVDSGAVTGTPNGAVMDQGLAENRGKTNKQIKESKTPSSSRMTDREIRQHFEQWWQAYPRKVERKGAEAKYASIVKRGEASPAELLAGAEAESASGKERKYTKNPMTWLNRGCWADERTPTSAAPKPNGGMDEFWREKIPKFQKDGTWSIGAFGPRPGEPGC
jgi:hypothetical protein